MADTSTYPATLDGNLRALVPAGTTPAGYEDYLQLLGSAADKIETELGLNPSGGHADVVTRLNNLGGILGPFVTTSLATTSSAYGYVGGVSAMTKITVPRAGYITGLSVLGLDGSAGVLSVTAGTFTLTVEVNGSTVITKTIVATNVINTAWQETFGTYAVAAGDLVRVKFATSSGFTPNPLLNLIALVEIGH